MEVNYFCLIILLMNIFLFKIFYVSDQAIDLMNFFNASSSIFPDLELINFPPLNKANVG